MTEYIYTVAAAALAVSMLVTLAGRGSMGTLVKLLAGMFMALTLISPVLKLELPDPQAWIGEFDMDGRAAAAEGKQLADNACRTIIKEQTQSYIMDKAARYGVSLAADVILDEAGIPVEVTLTGIVSDDTKAGLTRELAEELGLEAAALRWIGSK